MIVNETHVTENSSFSGMLVDSYGNGVANQTITYHELEVMWELSLLMKMVNLLLNLPDIYPIQQVTIIMMISNSLEMANIRDAHMKVMLL